MDKSASIIPRLSSPNEPRPKKRGRLRVFLGLCAGVGKTYAMLKAVRKRAEERVDVVIGLVETHGRAETATLMEGLIVAERKRVETDGMISEELDIENLLFLQPELVVVDDLAHENAKGSKNSSRHLDIEELLTAGIDVYTTLNFTQLESQRQTLPSLFGQAFREFIPNAVEELIDDIELVDVTPDRMLQRLSDGKIFLETRDHAAMTDFLSGPEFVELREQALQFISNFVSAKKQAPPSSLSLHEEEKSKARLLVAVGPSPYSLRLVRWARRLAHSMNVPWMAVHVETPGVLAPEAKKQLDRNLSFARKLGAEVILTHADNPSEALLHLAHENNVAQIVVGKPRGSRVLDFLRGGGLVDRLVRDCGAIDVYVVPAETGPLKTKFSRYQFTSPSSWREYVAAIAVVAGITLGGIVVENLIGYWSLALFYLFSVVVLSLFLNPGPVFAAAALSAATWDFLFLPPKYAFVVGELHDTMMFVMYFVIAMATGHLTSRLRLQQRSERIRELRATALYRLVQTVVSARNVEELFKNAADEISELFQAQAAFLTADSQQSKVLQADAASRYVLTQKELTAALWAYRNGRNAGCFTDMRFEAEGYYIPLRAGEKCVGILGIKPVGTEALILFQRDILETFAGQIGLAIEREKLRAATQASELAAKSQALQKTLFNSISHELRTPLSIIHAASAQLNLEIAEAPHKALLGEIDQAATRLSRLVQNLLNSARLESGQLQPKFEWGHAEDIVSGAIRLLHGSFDSTQATIDIPEDLPPICVDFGLLQQALANLLDNAIVHTPERTPIRITASHHGKFATLAVEDEGPGLSSEVLNHLFEKFYRASDSTPGGTGLGLSIAKHLIEANHGELIAANRPGKGAIFTIRLPIDSPPDNKLELT